MTFTARLRAATHAAGVHLICSVAVAVLAGLLVFGLWYPHPYNDLSGGRELFFLVMAVDVVCGPLLTAVIFNPAKPRGELWRDLGLVVLIQVAALGYGIFTVWQARPLFLVMEIDRFKVVAEPDLHGASPAELSTPLRPTWFAGPTMVAVREFKDRKEQQTVMMESLDGGRDIAGRPDFYLLYEGEAARKSWLRAKKLDTFLEKYPSQRTALSDLATKKRVNSDEWRYLPVMGRQDWIAIIDNSGAIQGFMPGDGF
jgi:hypothetical protein